MKARRLRFLLIIAWMLAGPLACSDDSSQSTGPTDIEDTTGDPATEDLPDDSATSDTPTDGGVVDTATTDGVTDVEEEVSTDIGDAEATDVEEDLFSDMDDLEDLVQDDSATDGDADSGTDDPAAACTESGGSVATRSCCGSTSDYPDLCVVGACGCAPDSSHDVQVCDCGEGRCFDGSTCVDPLEAACGESGGTAQTAMCCAGTDDYPDLCAVGACGCAPDSSEDTQICNCGGGRCFDGVTCVDLLEAACVGSGGTVQTTLCCSGADDYPDLCAVGACGCAPDSSENIQTCACGEGRCFDGAMCVAE